MITDNTYVRCHGEAEMSEQLTAYTQDGWTLVNAVHSPCEYVIDDTFYLFFTKTYVA